MSKEVVVLVHGFFTGSRDMAYLESGLREAGFETSTVKLPTTFGTLRECVDALQQQMPLVDDIDRVHFVAQSMGGLIVREYIALFGKTHPGNCVLIATPHGGTQVASVVNKLPLYTRVFKPVKHLLPQSNHTTFGSDKGFKLGVIAGNRHRSLFWDWVLQGPNDGRVEVESAQAVDADECLVLPFGHKDIHHQKLTLDQVAHFLRQGTFISTAISG